MDSLNKGRRGLLLLLVTIWGMRLTLHLIVRKAEEGWKEDARYPDNVLILARGEANPLVFHLVSLLQVFVLQSCWMFLIAQPLLVVFAHSNSGDGSTWGSLRVTDYVACAVWAFGFIFEAGSDLQLMLFKKHRQPGQVCDTGFFRNTRHPNYFGDFVVWVSFGIMAAPLNVAPSLCSLASPVMMFVLLRYVSGVVINDRVQAERKPHYRAYISSTPAFFPWCRSEVAAASPSRDEYETLR